MVRYEPAGHPHVLMLTRRYLDISVLTAAQQRLAWVFERFERICLSFSGGKDSTVLFHLAAAEARRRGRRMTVLFIDWEAQFSLTIEHVRSMLALYADCVDPIWACVPLRTTNACSVVEPEWVCWDPAKRPLWVRELPPEAAGPDRFPFYRDHMTFEEFIEAFGRWLARDGLACSLIGNRAQESFHRLRSIAKEDKASSFEGRPWLTVTGHGHVNAYPLYDWQTSDVWTFHAKSGLPHNGLYDLMHRAGVNPHHMRICEPYGDEQRQGLWLYHVLEPATWARVVARVAGANTGALYANEQGRVSGRGTPTLPPGYTWSSYVEFLLGTLPPNNAEHFRNKIAVYRRWWQVNRDLQELPEEQEKDCGSFDVPSWRRVAKMLLKNDYWATTLCFGPQRTHAYDRYRALMEKRRQEWGIYDG